MFSFDCLWWGVFKKTNLAQTLIAFCKYEALSKLAYVSHTEVEVKIAWQSSISAVPRNLQTDFTSSWTDCPPSSMEYFMWRVLNYVSVCKRQIAASCSPGQRKLHVAAGQGLFYFCSDWKDLWSSFKISKHECIGFLQDEVLNVLWALGRSVPSRLFLFYHV